MQKQMYIFRCPEAELAALERLCTENHIDMSRAVVTALLMMTDRLAEQGVLPPRELPPSITADATAASTGGPTPPLTPSIKPKHGEDSSGS